MRSLAILLVAIAALACGGGDDDNATPDAGHDANMGGGGQNREPVAAAGPDRAIFALTDTALDGLASSDPDDDPLNYAWAQTAGPTVELVGADTATPRFAAPASGAELTFALTVSDGTLEATDEVVLTVRDYAGEVPQPEGNPLVDTSGYPTFTNGFESVVVGDYLFVAGGTSGLLIEDISDPSAPTFHRSVNTPNRALAVVVAGNFAFVADMNNQLQIYDVRDYVAGAADPAAPVSVGPYTVGGTAYAVAVAGNYLLIGQALGLEVADIRSFLADDAAPAPVFVGTVNTSNYGWRVRVVGDRAYVSMRADVGRPGGLAIVDVGKYLADTPDPGPPELVSQWLGGGVYGVAVADDLAYVAYNDNVSGIGWWGDLRVVDLTDETAPVEDVSRRVESSSTPYRVELRGDRLFALTSRGMDVFDVSGSGPLRHLITYQVSLSRGLSFIGDLAYIAPSVGPLAVIDTSDLANPGLVGFVRTGDVGTEDLAPAGELAFVSTGASGARILDLADPTAPVFLDGFDYTETGAQQLRLSGDYLYAIYDALQVIDVSDWISGAPAPTPPAHVASYDAWTGVTNHILATDTHLFVGSSSGLYVVDVADPSAPTAPAGGAMGQLPTSPMYGGALHGDYLYAGVGSAGFHVIDVSDPATPELAGSLPTGWSTHVALYGDYAYVAREDDTIVVDVSSPSEPVAGMSLPFEISGHLLFDGGEAYAPGTTTLRLDLADPAQPVPVAGYSTTSIANGLALRDGLVIVADGSSGIEVIQMPRVTLAGNHADVAAGSELAYTLVWTDDHADLHVACHVTGGICAVTDIDRVANTATITWTAPDQAGDHAIRATVGNHVAWASGYGRVRVP